MARRIGDVQARILLSFFYFVILAPFALVLRRSDPLAIRPGAPRGWRPREAERAPGRRAGPPAVLMDILGVSCYFHDAAAALVRDGRLVAAVEEERFSRKKHDYGFPSQRDRLLPPRGRDLRRRARLRGVLREAVPQVRAPSPHVHAGLPPVPPAVPGGHDPVARGQAVDPPSPPDAPRRARVADPVQRAPSLARRQRLLLLAVPRGRHPHRGRRGGVDHRHRRGRARARTSPCSRRSASRTRSGSCTAPSPPSWASRSTRASTR